MSLRGVAKGMGYMKIIVDAMGGDNAPGEIVKGALAAHRAYGTEIVLVGRAAQVLRAVGDCGEKTLPAGVEIRDATEVVEIADDPAMSHLADWRKDTATVSGTSRSRRKLRAPRRPFPPKRPAAGARRALS